MSYLRSPQFAINLKPGMYYVVGFEMHIIQKLTFNSYDDVVIESHPVDAELDSKMTMLIVHPFKMLDAYVRLS